MKRKTHKKAQLMAQPFVYIFALILGALILVWGIKMIVDFVGTANKAELGKTMKSIDSDVSEFYHYDEGAEKPRTLSLPKGINYLCVADPGARLNCRKKTKQGISNCDIEQIDGTLEVLVTRTGSKDNVFTAPMENAGLNNGRFSIENLKPSQGNPLCFANGVQFVITTKAAYVEAS
ncbi:MAG: hypothetical protein KJ955_00820 [Nanoarchaeota archaeon]|nr:hypothetical protein [Nanoarchaeota archaeon]